MGRILKRSFLRFFKLAIFDKLKFIHMGVEEQWACELGLHRRRCVTKHLAPTPLAYAAGFLLAETVPRKNRPFWWPFVKEKQQNTKQNKKNKKKKYLFVCLLMCCFWVIWCFVIYVFISSFQFAPQPTRLELNGFERYRHSGESKAMANWKLRQVHTPAPVKP